MRRTSKWSPRMIFRINISYAFSPLQQQGFQLFKAPKRGSNTLIAKKIRSKSNKYKTNHFIAGWKILNIIFYIPWNILLIFEYFNI
jgi:hypothetical protein